jgi:23S rRNA pseudouridine2605 synthase
MNGEAMRLQKNLAHCELCSRRKAEEQIGSLCVTVNGKVASIGDSVDTTEDIGNGNSKKIGSNGISLKSKTPLVLMLNIPKGYVCLHYDKFREKTIFDLISRHYCNNRLLFCGRLDKDTTGLVFLSDDGEFVQEISHPSASAKNTTKS